MIVGKYQADTEDSVRKVRLTPLTLYELYAYHLVVSCKCEISIEPKGARRIRCWYLNALLERLSVLGRFNVCSARAGAS
jgi:hypothetical protein